VLISKEFLAKFRPNFAKFGNFAGGRNFDDTEIKNLDPNLEGQLDTTVELPKNFLTGKNYQNP